MSKSIFRSPWRGLVLACVSIVVTSLSWNCVGAQTQPAAPEAAQARTDASPGAARASSKKASNRADPLEAFRREVNANVVSIISGNITGTYLRYAADIASVLGDGTKVRVLPILSAGAVQNVTDIIFLRGVDMGFVRTDSIEAIRRQGKLGDIAKNIRYITRLVDDEMHVVAPVEITDLRQLAGKKVNFDVVGSGTHFSCELVFERLGIPVEITSYEQAVAYEKLKAGEISASIFFGGKPVAGVANFADASRRFHLVPVRFEEKFSDYYLPATLSGKDYPNLLGPGEQVDTIAAPTLLAVYNLAADTDRYERVARFVDAFFSKFPEFMKPPRHPKWREVNLNATAPGWTRFKPAQDWLDRAVTSPPEAQSQKPGKLADQLSGFRRYLLERVGDKKLSPEETVKLLDEYQKRSGN
jgi:uncharacterized protein